jgi:hypothetical protein
LSNKKLAELLDRSATDRNEYKILVDEGADPNEPA